MVLILFQNVTQGRHREAGADQTARSTPHLLRQDGTERLCGYEQE